MQFFQNCWLALMKTCTLTLLLWRRKKGRRMIRIKRKRQESGMRWAARHPQLLRKNTSLSCLTALIPPNPWEILYTAQLCPCLETPVAQSLRKHRTRPQQRESQWNQQLLCKTVSTGCCAPLRYWTPRHLFLKWQLSLPPCHYSQLSAHTGQNPGPQKLIIKLNQVLVYWFL